MYQPVNTLNSLQKLHQLQAAASPQTCLPSQLSPQSDIQNMTNSASLIPKIGTPLQVSTPLFMAHSPSPVVEDSEIKPSAPAVPTVSPAVGGQVSYYASATPSGPSAAICRIPGGSVLPLLDCTPSLQTMSLQDQAQAYVGGNADEKQLAIEPPIEGLIRALWHLIFPCYAAFMCDRYS
ncbi:hypothetical protein GOP47_0005609 [Adiantum capillus-veneris]|uniref:Uncharacterized protein n=1 Tax=Adiantum capillus-veneris TaxID=13818 RepID=A0A9D4V5E0_ADICA|nr:hypothetical protein GOP47_0005609 [Adiantum capillus-veneris]